MPDWRAEFDNVLTSGPKGAHSDHVTSLTPRLLVGASRAARITTAVGTLAVLLVAAPATAPTRVPTSPNAPRTATVAALTAPRGASLVAVARRSVVRAVSPNGTRTWRLHNPNADGAPLVMLVIGQRTGGYLVRIPARPNGSTGWIRESDVTIGVTEYSLRISKSRHLLYVYRLGALKRTVKVGLGRPSAPTPSGRYFLAELLQSSNPYGAYGPYAYGLSAFSSVYTEFEGGPGQIGMHGTNDPSSIGRNVSHGCIRMGRTNIIWLARRVPAGTPITITR